MNGNDNYVDPNDYTKDRVSHIGFSGALAQANSGWVIARQGWPAGRIVFMAKEGSFVAVDLVTGYMENFLVLRDEDGQYEPYVPSGRDVAALDWAAITRQVFQRQMPTQKGSERRRDPIAKHAHGGEPSPAELAQHDLD
jgi:hypothetical protein